MQDLSRRIGGVAWLGRAWPQRVSQVCGQIERGWRRWRPDWFILGLIAAVTTASLLPCRGEGAQVFKCLGIAAISALFFLQGARLSRDAVVAGMTHWRLHLAIASATFILFPLLGLGLIGAAGHQLPGLLRTGILFVAVLPSTVQS